MVGDGYGRGARRIDDSANGRPRLGPMALSRSAQVKAGSIEFGGCASAEHFETAVRLGFDYFEMEVTEISQMDDATFAALKAKVLASPIRCRAFRSLIRKYQVVGENASAQQNQVKAYLEQNLDRCRQLGGRVVVWGSSQSRKCSRWILAGQRLAADSGIPSSPRRQHRGAE